MRKGIYIYIYREREREKILYLFFFFFAPIHLYFIAEGIFFLPCLNLHRFTSNNPPQILYPYQLLDPIRPQPLLYPIQIHPTAANEDWIDWVEHKDHYPLTFCSALCDESVNPIVRACSACFSIYRAFYSLKSLFRKLKTPWLFMNTSLRQPLKNNGLDTHLVCWPVLCHRHC